MKRVLLAALCAVVWVVGCGKGDDAGSNGSAIGTWLVDSSSQRQSTAGEHADGSEEGGNGAYITLYVSHKIKIESNQISFISECSIPEVSQSTVTTASSPITIDSKGITLQNTQLNKTGGLSTKYGYVECNVNVNAYGPLPYTRVDDTHLRITLTGGKKTLTIVQ